MTKAIGHKLKYSKFLNIREGLFYSKSSQALAQLAQRGCSDSSLQILKT